jgi:hypothetical protein
VHCVSEKNVLKVSKDTVFERKSLRENGQGEDLLRWRIVC